MPVAGVGPTKVAWPVESRRRCLLGITATAIAIHIAAGAWNKAMLDNSALPSGALVYTAADRQLTAE